MFVFPTKLIPKSDTAHSGLKAGLSLFYRPFAIFVLPSSYNQYNCSYLFEEEKNNIPSFGCNPDICAGGSLTESEGPQGRTWDGCFSGCKDKKGEERRLCKDYCDDYYTYDDDTKFGR